MDTVQGAIELAYLVYDGSDVRQITVVAERPVLLGFARRKFFGALREKLSCDWLFRYALTDLCA